MSNKTKQMINLENWYGIDYILFGKPSKKHLSEEDLEKYRTTKAAMLSNLFEIYIPMNFSNEERSIENSRQIIENGILRAKNSLDKSKEILSDKAVSNIIKEEVDQIVSEDGFPRDKTSNYIMKKKYKSTAIDILCIESFINDENINVIRPTEENWKNKVILDSHKAMRNTLVEMSI